MSRNDPPAIQAIKAKAKAMMQTLADQDEPQVRHNHCLHALAQQAGYKDWYTYQAALREQAGLAPTKRLESRRRAR
ncbi:hypothetical protein GO986_08885 [Deinococcus sp. HMF7620]|uniref:Glyoxalase-related protein domain-containing protein n=1 Tax=Deinococcus arboris TaxID=2682977 RepID=A0A7C9LKQ7_9DEIO|nr:hypothetical protein [Deinococcus arboris]